MTAVSQPIQAILELFEGPLSEVRFADVDAPSLRRLAAEVEAANAQVESHEAALTAARQALSDRQEQLLVHAQRALAYARVYAESDEELSARLASVNLPRAAKRQRGDKADKPEKSAHAQDTAVSPARDAEASPPTDDAEPARELAADDAAPAPAAARRGKRRETRVVALDETTESA